jgi:polyhydroxyalkanoate synthesis repressor PhaR
MHGPEAPIVIKRYANRRLYNTGAATYVSLDDLAGMVRLGEDFLVRDAGTGDDITRSILTLITSPLTEH